MPAPAPLDRRARLSLLVILALGALLRLWTIDAGAPFTWGVDEGEIVERVLHMLRTGDFHPHFFDYPGLTFYLHLVVAAARFLSGAMARDWASLDQIWGGDLLVWGRAFSALLSAATVYVVFRIGLRWSVRVGLLAALATAVQPQLVQNAHYVLTDTPLTFFVTAALLGAIRAGEIGQARAFFLAGVLAGLATATKYNGAVAALAPLLVAVFAPALQPRAAMAAAALAGSAAGFLLGAPYSLLDLPGFLNGFAGLMQHYNQPRSALETADTYRKYVQDWFGLAPLPTTIRRILAWPAMLLTAAGLISMIADLRSASMRARAIPLLAFSAAYFWLISGQSLVYARYAMPIAPVLSIALAIGALAAGAWMAARTRTPLVRRLAWAILGLILAQPLATAVKFNLDRRNVSTIEQAARWLVEHVAPGELVVLETNSMRLPPARVKTETTLKLSDVSLDRYHEQGARYLVANSIEYDKYFANPSLFTRQVAFYSELFKTAEPVQTFPTSADHPGPTIRIFRLVRKP